MSRHRSLPTWDKPVTPCLASRIRHGIEVTGYRLARVDRAEIAARTLLLEAGIQVRDLRVRDLGGSVRVEVDAAAVQAAAAAPGLGEAVATAGFGAAIVDVRAFRSGALSSEQGAPPML